MLPRMAGARFLVWTLACYALAIGCLMASFSGPLSLQIVCLFMSGACVGATMTVSSATIMQAAPSERAGMAASIEEVCYVLGAGLGIAVMGSVMAAVYSAAIVLFPGVALTPGVRESIDTALTIAEGMSP
jgi:DHA2 family multidrug resistance protein-like MFS transporter